MHFIFPSGECLLVAWERIGKKRSKAEASTTICMPSREARSPDSSRSRLRFFEDLEKCKRNPENVHRCSFVLRNHFDTCIGIGGLLQSLEFHQSTFFQTSHSGAIMMPSIKRQASDSFSQPQSLVKRQKSNSDLNESRALTVGGKGQDGALVPSVCLDRKQQDHDSLLTISSQCERAHSLRPSWN